MTTFDARMPNMSYLDLSASWKVVEECGTAGRYQQPFLDKDPPIVSSNVVGQRRSQLFSRPTTSSDVSCSRGVHCEVLMGRASSAPLIGRLYAVASCRCFRELPKEELCGRDSSEHRGSG